MKKLLITILFLASAACSPGLTSHPSSPSAVSKQATATVQMQVTPSQISSALVTTEIPALTSTALPGPTPTLTVDNIVERMYDPGEWKMLYDKNTVWTIDLDPAGRMWISPGLEVGYFDGHRWVFFSPKDYLLPRFWDMAMAPDGTVWVSSLHALSRYQHGRWETFPIPDVDTTTIPRISIDASGAVWVRMSSCPTCGFFLKKFDGKRWSDLPLWSTKRRTYYVPIILFTPDGALWAADDTGEIGRYDGKAWKIYSKMDLWTRNADWAHVIQITSDHKGNIFSVYTGESSWQIARIDTNGQVTKIPYSTNLEINPNFPRLFVDRQNTLWVNACLKNKEHACLAYYKDNQWVSFINLPFSSMMDIKELPDGTYLVATAQGLYQFKSAK